MNLRNRILSYAAIGGLSLLVIGCANPTHSGTAKPRSKQAGITQYVEGYQAYQNGDKETARKVLEEALQNDPSLLMARNLLGQIYRDNSNYNAAVAQYAYLSEVDPYTLNNHYYLGVSYQLLTRNREATVAYLKGLNIDPNDFRCNMNIGTAYLALGELDSAVKYLDHATQLDPNSPVAWSNLGVALDARNSLVLAETAYRKALEQNPNSTTILQNLANNLLAQKKTGESIYLWEQIVAKNDTAYAGTRLAESYTLGSDFTKAHARLDQVLGKDTRYVPAINAKATAYVRQYELSGFAREEYRIKAVELYRRSLSLNKNQTDVAREIDRWKNESAIGK